jgi:HlyD family secretion protein
MLKKIIPIAIVLAVIVTVILVIFNRHREFLYAGTVEATELDLSSRLSATIGEITVQEGDNVKKDDVLVRLSSDDITVAADLAQRDFKRAQALLKAGSMDEGTFDKIRNRYQDSNVRLSWLTISAPSNATIITKYHEPGELVSPGTKILHLAELDTVWAYVYVPQPLLSKLAIGAKLNGVVSDSDKKPMTGTIVKINSEAEFTPKNVQTETERTRLVYGIKIEFANTDRYLKPGMTVEMKLPVQ